MGTVMVGLDHGPQKHRLLNSEYDLIIYSSENFGRAPRVRGVHNAVLASLEVSPFQIK